MVRRGEIWWADLSDPVGSEPGYRRPVVILQADVFNATRIDTTIVAAITSNMRRAGVPGNVKLASRESGLGRDSIVNLTQLLTVNKADLLDAVGILGDRTLERVSQELQRVLALR